MSRAPRLIAALCTLSLVAACGGDSTADDTTTTASPTTETTDAPTEPTDPEPETTEPVTTEPEPETTESEPDPEPETTEPVTTEPADDEPEVDRVTLLGVAAESGEFTILLTAVETAGLTDELTTRDYTLLAPTDAAFEALGQETLDALQADPAALAAVLANHVLPMPQSTDDIALFRNVIAVGGASWVIQPGDPLVIGEATVIAPNIEADNGVVHVLDSVLILDADDEVEG